MEASPADGRVEQLLARANQLAEEGLEVQRQALQRQADVFAKIDVHLQRAREINERASQVSEQAMGVSRLARKFLLGLLPVIVLLIGYVSYLIFFRIQTI